MYDKEEAEFDVIKDSDVEKEDNIYVYSEEDDEKDTEANLEPEDFDTSPYNYSQMSGETDTTEDNQNMSDERSNTPIFKLLLIMLSNPTEGWKKVRREKVTVESAQMNCFYPLLALMAISHFASMFYNSRLLVSEILVEAVTSFVGYFAGYFLIIILLKALLPSNAGKSIDTDFGKVFVILNLSSLCIFFTAMELLPMLWAVLIFLPLWTVYAICRGVRFFKFPEDKSITCTGLICLLIIGVPSLIEWGLTELLPK